MEPWLQEAMAIGERQDGLVTYDQLSAAGASRKIIAGVVRDGWLRRGRRGVYVFAGTPRTWRQHLHCAVLAGNAVGSNSCAAEFWQFRHLPYLTLEVTVERRQRVRLPGVHTHHVTTLAASDVTRHFGLPTTTFERTLVDCSTVLSPFQLSANLDDGLRRGVASLRALRECVERLHSGPLRRLSVIHDLLDARPARYHPGGSSSERRVFDVLTKGGLPAPAQQFKVIVGNKTYYLDYAYPAQRVLIEYYGSAVHGTPSAVVYDSERISDLVSQQWLPLIFTDATPDHVMVSKTAALLGLEAPVAA
jgi:putative AbiEi antitoxin of type IV toxin-antitoxin system